MPAHSKQSRRLAVRSEASRAAQTTRLCAQARMSKLFAAALTAGGELEVARATLRISRKVLQQRLSLLRAHGVARGIAVIDPIAAGRPVQSLCLVRLRRHALPEMRDFELSCVADPAITTATRVAGRHDYRLTAFHTDVRAAAAWARDLGARDDIAAVEHRFVRTLFGDELAGLPLRDERGAA